MKETQFALFEALLFFGLSFGFYFMIVEPDLIYAINGIFMKTFPMELRLDFFLSSISPPGGLADYLVNAMTHLFYHSWLGALILCLTGVVLFLISRALFDRRGIVIPFIHYIPAIALMLAYCWYAHRHLIVFVQTIMVCSLFISTGAVRQGGRRLRVVLVALACIAGWMTAGWSWPLIVVLACLFDTVPWSARWRLWPLLTAGLGIGLYWIETVAWDKVTVIAPADPDMDLVAQAIILLYFPIALLLVKPVQTLVRFIGRRIAGQRRDAQHVPRRKKSRRTVPRPDAAPAVQVHPLVRPAVSLIWVTGVFTVIILTFMPHNNSYKMMAQCTQAVRSSQWQTLLKTITPQFIPRSPSLLGNMLIQALYHTGQLGSKLFRYPLDQTDAPLLLWNDLRQEFTPAVTLSIIPLLDLGAVNTAEKNAFETLEVASLPWALEYLATTQLAKGAPGTAAIFATNLMHMPFFGKTGRTLLHACADSSVAAQMPRIRTLRRIMDRSDYEVLIADDEEQLLLSLLQANPRNRMAYEYLMTFYLLRQQLDRFVNLLPAMQAAGINRLPQHWEEAVLIHLFNSRDDRALNTLVHDPAVRMAFDRFNQIYGAHHTNIDAAEAALFDRFGTTYFFYYVFGYTGYRRVRS